MRKVTSWERQLFYLVRDRHRAGLGNFVCDARKAMLSGLLLFCVGCIPSTPQAPPVGGRKLLSGTQSAAATVQGYIHGPQRIDQTGYTATATLEKVNAGTLPSSGQVTIAWEELSPSRPPRFNDGDRVIVALKPLPTASFWRTRFPQPSAARDVFVVAEDGDAFMLRPDAESILTLSAYLKLPRKARTSSDGAATLAAMVARAAPELAIAAASQLRDLNDAPPLSSAAEKDLAQALQGRDAPQLQSLIIEIATRYRVATLRPQLATLGNSPSNLAFNALMAVVAIDGGLPTDHAQAFLSDPSPAKRMVAVHMARGATLEQVMPLLSSDPDPGVRAAAARALIDQRSTAAMSEVMRALSDPAISVRTEAARALGRLGPSVVSPLLDLAKSSSPETGQAAVLALEATGGAGIDALRELSHDHPDQSVRQLAKLALGKLEDPH